MKKRLLVLFLAVCLLLSGCSAMLERSYSVATPHVDRPTTAEDPSVLRVENYGELVSAVLYLVSQHAEEGVIQLHNYDGSEEEDLATACLEVATQDPLGAYAVEYIKHEFSRVVSYYQATLAIRYRRTAKQVDGVVGVTGSWAIRDRLQKALSDFEEEVVLRVAYFAEDEDSLLELVRQAYYDAPEFALGMPEVDIALYPDAGRERVVEFLLTYPEDPDKLRSRAADLALLAEDIAQACWGLDAGDVPAAALQALREQTAYAPQGPSDAYGALTQGAANSEGMALAFSLLCREADLTCRVVEGARNGEPRFWNAVSLPGREALYLDPSAESPELDDAQTLFDLGYRWPGGPDEPTEESRGAALRETAEDKNG